LSPPHKNADHGPCRMGTVSRRHRMPVVELDDEPIGQLWQKYNAHRGDYVAAIDDNDGLPCRRGPQRTERREAECASHGSWFQLRSTEQRQRALRSVSCQPSVNSFPLTISLSHAAYHSDHGNKRSNTRFRMFPNACHGNNNINNIRQRPRLFIETYSPLKWL
jgi:hypothetical protein